MGAISNVLLDVPPFPFYHDYRFGLMICFDAISSLQISNISRCKTLDDFKGNENNLKSKGFWSYRLHKTGLVIAF